MITFYPRDIGMWRKDFDFTPDITLTPKEKTNYKSFNDRDELIGFLKEHSVQLDNSQLPLKIIGPVTHDQLGSDTYMVISWTVLGWLKDDYK